MRTNATNLSLGKDFRISAYGFSHGKPEERCDYGNAQGSRGHKRCCPESLPGPSLREQCGLERGSLMQEPFFRQS